MSYEDTLNRAVEKAQSDRWENEDSFYFKRNVKGACHICECDKVVNEDSYECQECSEAIRSSTNPKRTKHYLSHRYGLQGTISISPVRHINLSAISEIVALDDEDYQVVIAQLDEYFDNNREGEIA